MVSMTFIRRVLVLGVLWSVFPAGPVWGDILFLKDGTEWQNVSDTPEGRYRMAVAKFKQLISSGQAESAAAELVNLKQTYPEIKGPDFDLFVEAELLFAGHEWIKAARKYGELLDGFPDSWLYDTAMDRQFSVAQAFLNGQKRRVLKILKLSAFDEGEKIMRRIADRTGEAPIARRALVALARAYSRRKEFLEAYEVWADISLRWGTGEMGTTALLEMAQTLHSAYTSSDYDHTSLVSAKTHYKNFKARYPQLVEVYEIDEKLKRIEEQLAYKQYSIGEYYDRTGSREAAELYYEDVVDNWPDTAAAEMVQKRRLAWSSGLKGVMPGQKKTLPRKLFDASNIFVDNWFGLRFLGGKAKQARPDDGGG